MCTREKERKRTQHKADPQASTPKISPADSTEATSSSDDDDISSVSSNSKNNENGIILPSETTLSSKEEDNHKSENENIIYRFLFCAAGINICYLYYGVIQERLLRKRGDGGLEDRPITSFILVSQAVTNAIVALVWMFVEQRFKGKQYAGKNNDVDGGVKDSLNHRLLLLTSFSYSVAMTASNESLNYISYPTATLGKSCKLVPTMIAGLFVEKKNYTQQEWFSAACITIGIILFNLSRTSSPTKGSGDSLSGLGPLFLSLFMDGILCWCQGLLKKTTQRPTSSQSNPRFYRPPSPLETMLYSNLYAILFFGPYAFLTGQYTNGMHLLQNSPKAFGSTMLKLNGMAAMGQFFIFTTIDWFSPVMCTTLTTTRKFFTILLSVQRFGHVFTWSQWCSVMLVFGGLYVQIACKVYNNGGRNVAAKRVVSQNDIDRKKID